MKLHRSTGHGDWEDVSPAARNLWQRLAARTNGIVTPGNAVTLAGLAVAFYALWLITRHHPWLGLIGLAIGRIFDLADGAVAARTETKGPIGEAFDATSDKLILFASFVAFVLAAYLPWVVVVILVVPQAITSLLSLYAKLRGRTVHPTRAGKVSTALLWVALVGLVLLDVLHLTAFDPIDYAIAAIAFVLSLIALVDYLRQAKSVRP